MTILSELLYVIWILTQCLVLYSFFWSVEPESRKEHMKKYDRITRERYSISFYIFGIDYYICMDFLEDRKCKNSIEWTFIPQNSVLVRDIFRTLSSI